MEKTSAPLDLPYRAFDQTPHSGWRALAEKEQFQEAAALIAAYLDRHSELDRFQRATLHWHAAQALAFAGDAEAALGHLSLARLDPEPLASPVCWNDYVAATEAFLQRDRAKLTESRERIVEKKRDDANLPIVDSLIAHFDEPYSKAYRAK